VSALADVVELSGRRSLSLRRRDADVVVAVDGQRGFRRRSGRGGCYMSVPADRVSTSGGTLPTPRGETQ
jgi:hypothetical protein